MRPIPRPRHVLAIAILIAVAGLYGGLAAIDPELSDAQMDIATAALKDHRPDLYPHDPVFGGRLWRFHTPVFLGMLQFALIPTGYSDLALPFRIFAGIVTLVYLLGAYGLLYRQCHSWSVSVFVAILSTAIIDTLGRTAWGIGSLGSISPPMLCLAVVPILVLTFLHYGDPTAAPARQWRLLWVFAFVGLLGNLHLVTAMNLAIVLAIVHVGRQRFAPRAWPLALLGLVCSLVVALPYASYYVALHEAASPEGHRLTYEQAVAAFRLGNLAVVYPDIFKSMLNWLLAVAVLLVPAAAVLPRMARFHIRHLSFWAWFVLAGLFVAFVLQGASQLVGFFRDQAPPVIDFVQASSLVMLPLYVLFAQALTNLFRLLRGHRALVRWGCVALMAGWIIPSDNVRVIRRAALDTATVFMDEADKPQNVQRHHETARREEELARLADWARRNTDPSAVFLTESVEFRMLSQRAVLATENDVRYIYYLAPWRLEEWMARFNEQSQLLRPEAGDRSGAEALRDFVHRLATQKGFEDVREWYVILRAQDAARKGETLAPIFSDQWGRYYAVYRLR